MFIDIVRDDKVIAVPVKDSDGFNHEFIAEAIELNKLLSSLENLNVLSEAYVDLYKKYFELTRKNETWEFIESKTIYPDFLVDLRDELQEGPNGGTF